jgi:AcrR family transcriptional regulator
MDNKENILKKALELFSRYGYEGTGVQAIVEAASISKPTMYHYYGSKLGLLEDIISINNGRILTLLEKVTFYNRDIVKNIHDIIRLYFNDAKSNREYHRMILSMSYYPVESEAYALVTDAFSGQIFLMSDMFGKAVKEHGNMRGRNNTYAYSLLGTINTYIGIYFSGGIALEEADALRLSNQFMYGIFS